ncbi:metalloregulator ArsR/SmtB family transcription factor [Neisseria sp. ZJ106]|uniref:Metalloregulator ArsR/SmtB family transcription factor n=1 Tax=Neisseria lisongii TaxID=2912188 RepID=A0ABY7RKF5_9NEIS|nr:metalloregulator ArsR/SmtB family transcription factor [Neisseria lisongii]MCF7521305.1 metalloregulator ArsR/SmtB family transcription factor [Neisseria lisongii]WCL72109.1 metalloregulator ArsR/SmtB family transcription factor [Neisseria lisongii]
MSNLPIMDTLRECIPTFTVLSDENRHKIIQLLFEQGRLNVNELTERLHLSRPAVSHHLKLLLSVEVVRVEQQGKERFYSLSFEKSFGLLQQLVELMGVHCPLNQAKSSELK